MRDGIWLAYLANALDKDFPSKKVYEGDSHLQYRYSDNINIFMDYMRRVAFPEIFHFELTDLYEKKNFPKVVYCIHALGCFLSGKGVAAPMKNLVGKLEFTPDEIEEVSQALAQTGVALPCFKGVTKHVARATGQEISASDLKSSASVSDVRSAELKSPEESHYSEEDKIEEEVNEEQPESAEAGEEASDVTIGQESADIEDVQEGDDMAAALENAAIIVQRVFRETLAKDEAQLISDIKKAVHTVESKYLSSKAIIEKISHIHKDRMATIIQRAYRRYLAKSELEKMKNEFEAKMHSEVDNALKRLKSSAAPNLADISLLLKSIGSTGENYILERECEYRRRELTRAINESYTIQRDVNNVDKKISLLVHNKQETAEASKFSKKKKVRQPKSHSKLSGMFQNSGNLGTSKTSIGAAPETLPGSAIPTNRTASSLRLNLGSSALIKSCYGELSLLLRTHTKHLASLLVICSRRESPSTFKIFEEFAKALLSDCSTLEDEYLYIGLIIELAKLEIAEHLKVESLFKSNLIFVNFFISFMRLGKNAEYVKSLFQHLVVSVVGDNTLDLDLDPVSIYDKESKKQAVSMGEKKLEETVVALSSLKNNPTVKATLEHHIKRLADTSLRFLSSITSSSDNMPIGVKYVLTQLKVCMLKYFPDNAEDVMKFISILVYYKCFSPVIGMPDKYDIIEGPIPLAANSNLAEISRMLNQISTCKLLTLPNSPDSGDLNDFIIDSHRIFRNFLDEITEVYALPGYNEFDLIINALSPDEKIVIHLKESDMYVIHRFLLEYLKDVAAGKSSDSLGRILRTLPPPPVTDSREMDGNRVELVLDGMFPINEEDLVFHYRLLLVKAKELVMTVLKIQSGDNVFDLLEYPVESHHETKFLKLLREKHPIMLVNSMSCDPSDFVIEYSAPNKQVGVSHSNLMLNAASDTSPPPSVSGFAPLSESISVEKSPVHVNLSAQAGPASDNTTHKPDTPISVTNPASYVDLILERHNVDITFAKFKRITLEVMSKLEKNGEVLKSNKYCDIISHIVAFIVMQKGEPMHMKKVLAMLNAKLQKINEKNAFLREQKNSYDEYISVILANMVPNRRSVCFYPLNSHLCIVAYIILAICSLISLPTWKPLHI